MDNLQKQNIEQDSYKTGSTKPPKKRGGLVAGLLVAVILLAGVSSILGMMNIQLFRMLEAEKENSVAFVPSETKYVAPGEEQETTGKPRLGLTVGSISELDRRFYQLPAGALVSKADPQGCAADAGIAVGDIILWFNGARILTAQDLEQALQECQADDAVEVVFYRHRTGKEYRVTVMLANNG